MHEEQFVVFFFVSRLLWNLLWNFNWLKGMKLSVLSGKQSYC